MQDSLNQPLLTGKSISEKEYFELSKSRKNHEFVLFGDNTLECLTLLNPLVNPDTYLEFIALVHLPLDQPIYVFELPNQDLVSVKVAGSYTNWKLPREVAQIVYRYDLPDFVLFSVKSQKVIFAGELTETASVGNSQWQRELRKIAAAELKIPFIYQTVYSGKDDSQDTIREPTSLLVYNAMLYSIRYKVPSLVLFIEPNIENSVTRKRIDSLDTSAISNLLAGHLIQESTGNAKLRQKLEETIYEKMLDYLAEPKFKAGGNLDNKPRLFVDYPCAPKEVSSLVDGPSSEYASAITQFLSDEKSVNDFPKKYPWGDEQIELMKPWTDKRSMDYISTMFEYLEKKNLNTPIAPLGKFSVGIVKSSHLVKFLQEKCSGEVGTLVEKVSGYDETLIVPVLLHKKNYGSYQYCKDPYAGNTAAFSELLGFDTLGEKKRGILAYCVSENPEGFDLHQKYATNLYRSIAKYSDGILLDGKKIISKFKPFLPEFESNDLKSLLELQPINATEDSGLTSTYVQLTNVIGGWRVCMIAIHHSSWQQIRIRNKNGVLNTAKIGRNDAKVDLVLQDTESTFLAAEGKRTYSDFFSSIQEKNKIGKAFENVFQLIDNLFETSQSTKITTFICLLDVPEVNSKYFLEQEKRKISESIRLGHISEIVDGEFVVIGVYVNQRITKFELFFSNSFNRDLREQLGEMFS